MIYDDFSIRLISLEDGEETTEANIYLGPKDDFNKKFSSNLQILNKKDGKYSIKKPLNFLSFAKNAISEINLKDEEIEEVSEHFLNVYLNNIGGIDNFLKEKKQLLSIINNIDFNELILEKNNIAHTIINFIIKDDHNKFDISLFYNSDNDTITSFLIFKTLEGNTRVCFHGKSFDKIQYEILDKIKRTNKFRLFFLLNGKI